MQLCIDAGMTAHTDWRLLQTFGTNYPSSLAVPITDVQNDTRESRAVWNVQNVSVTF